MKGDIIYSMATMTTRSVGRIWFGSIVLALSVFIALLGVWNGLQNGQWLWLSLIALGLTSISTGVLFAKSCANPAHDKLCHQPTTREICSLKNPL